MSPQPQSHVPNGYGRRGKVQGDAAHDRLPTVRRCPPARGCVRIRRSEPGASWAQDDGGRALDEILSRFQDRIAACTAVRIQPGEGDVLGAHELGENEVPEALRLPRRSRGADAAGARAAAVSAGDPGDQAMTARIAKGELTRASAASAGKPRGDIRLTKLLNPPHTREQSADRDY